MIARTEKQFIIGAVYVILFVVIGYGAFRIIVPAPTCTDKMQNQEEEGVDCGVVCGTLCDPAVRPLEVKSSKLLKIRPGDYDFVAEIFNPNTIYGSRTVSYIIMASDVAGNRSAVASGSFSVLPAQTRFVVRTSLKASEDVVEATLVLQDALWQKINGDGISVDFPLRRESYTEPKQAGLPAGQAGIAAQYEGVIFNDSDFDFNTVDVAVVLLDDSGAIIGANGTTLFTVLSRTERYFKMTWPTVPAGEFARAQVQATTNVFENENFIRRYGVQEKFQEYYQGR